MNNDNGQNPVTIDVTPEAEDSPAKKPKGKGGILPLVIALLALIAVFAALFVAYRYTQQAAQDLAAINAKIERGIQAQQDLQEQLRIAEQNVAQQHDLIAEQKRKTEQQQQTIDLAQKTFSEQEKLLAAERQRMQQREVELRASVASVHRRMGTSGNQWVVAEAEYLLRIANHRLTLARDISTARNALKLADGRLRNTKDPSWNAVREQIARDLGKLDNVDLPDTPGISAKLASLIELTPQLQLNSATAGVQPPKPTDAASATHERTWDTLLDDLWQGFKTAVRIRRNDQPIQAMLPPEQQFFLYENLRQHLEVARLAVARNDHNLYRDSLKKVTNWLDLYFDPDNPATQRMGETTEALSTIDIRPQLPDITESLNALQVRRKLDTELSEPLPGSDKSAKDS